MAAGLGFKDFTTGEVLTAADVDGYLMQGIWVFANAAARDAAVTSPQEGNFAYLKDTNVTTYYTGSAWANLDTTGMTNPMTTTGDTIYSSSGSTPARLGIGSTGQVLTVAGGIPSWATPASGGGMTSLASGSLPIANVLNLTSISADYNDLRLVIRNAQHASGSGSGMGYRLNGQGDGGEYNPRLNIVSEGVISAGSDSTRIPLTYNDAKKDENITIQINIFDYANTSTNKRWQHSISYMKQGTTTWETNFQTGQYKFNNSAINQIQLYMDSSFSAGTYVLYGIK